MSPSVNFFYGERCEQRRSKPKGAEQPDFFGLSPDGNIRGETAKSLLGARTNQHNSRKQLGLLEKVVRIDRWSPTSSFNEGGNRIRLTILPEHQKPRPQCGRGFWLLKQTLHTFFNIKRLIY